MRKHVKKDGKFYGLLGSLLLGCVLGAAEIPQAAVPFTEEPPEIDGIFNETEWKASCVLKQVTPLGSRKSDGIATEFYLKYDRDHLYVAAVCSDPSGGGRRRIRGRGTTPSSTMTTLCRWCWASPTRKSRCAAK